MEQETAMFLSAEKRFLELAIAAGATAVAALSAKYFEHEHQRKDVESSLETRLFQITFEIEI